MTRTTLCIVALLVTCLLSTAVHAQQCAGNACGSIAVNYDGSCYHAVNTGSRSVNVAFTPYGGISSSVSKVVGPGEDWKPVLYGGSCMTGFFNPFNANYASANAKPGKAKLKLAPIRPDDLTKTLSVVTLWNAQPKRQEGAGTNATAVKANGEGIKKEEVQKRDDCGAGVYTRCWATINDPANQNLLVISGATEPNDAQRRAKQCRSDAINVTCASSAVLACAPFILCSAP